MIIFADRQTDMQSNTNSKTEAHSILYPLWIVGGAGQQRRMWREMRIFADTQSIKQAEISITEAHSNPLWSVDSRGAGQLL